MSRCKITTMKRFSINKTQYETILNEIKNSNFMNALQDSKKCFKLKGERQISISEFELPLKKNISNLYTIPVMIENKKYQFLIDTGAQISAIRKPLLDKIKVINANHQVDIGSIGGTTSKLNTYYIPKMQLGGITYFNTSVVLLDDHQFQLKIGFIDLINFDGIIGWDILSQLDFEIDDIEKKFKVLNNQYRFKEKNMILGGFPLFLCEDKSGKILKMGFDSGAQVSWLGKHYMNTYGSKHIRKATAIGFGVHGKEKIEIEVLDDCQMTLDKGQIELQDVMSGIVDLYHGFQFDGVLGNEIFRNRRIRILNSCERVLFL